jgi:UDP-N-acetylmuramoyl-tripeptide--D-alanyl-D-alanine ligase
MPDGSTRVRFPLNGRHNILNALAAAGAAFSFGIPVQVVASALETVPTPAQRGEVIRFAKGFTVINDSYNSNPTALRSMVDTIVNGRAGAKRVIVVAGEMLELGDAAEAVHLETGRSLASSGIDRLIGVRGLAKNLVEGARDAGLRETAFAVDSDEAGEMLAVEITEGDLVLIKGSRGVRTEKVLEKLLEQFEPEAKGAAVG